MKSSLQKWWLDEVMMRSKLLTDGAVLFFTYLSNKLVRMRKAMFFLLLSIPGALSAQLYVNEIMAGNQTGIQDDFFENEDWVEIYNAGSIVNLAGYYLSDDPDSLDKWQIPATNPGLTTVLPGGHLLFWLDNDPNQGEDHGTFRLSTDGESVILTMPDGVTIVDEITYPQQQPDISYGRVCDGCDEWIFFDVATPEAQNSYVTPETQLLYINEVMVQNITNVDDEFNEHEAWIEIFNPNAAQVNLAGYSIALNGGTPFTFPANDPVRTTIDGDGFAIFWADAEANQGADHLDFTIPLSGSLSLFGPDDSLVDTYDYQEVAADQSYGRSVDGGVSSISFNIPTPRVTNTIVILEPEELYVNEFMAENQSDTLDTALENEDWIEIFNPNPYEVDLAGYYLSDNPWNPMKWQFPFDHPDSTVIPAGGFLLLFADEQQSEGWNHVNFRLNNTGEWIILRSPDGFSIADEIQYQQQYGDTSYGRLTDGSPSWVYFLETTPEYSNNGALVEIDEQEEQATVYPNPLSSSDVLKLDKMREWKLWTSSGKLLYTGRSSEITILQGMPPGMYILLLDETYRAKILVRN